MTASRIARQLEQDLLALGAGERAFEALDVSARIARVVGSDQPAAYGVDRHERSFRLEFFFGSERWAPGLPRALDRVLRGYSRARLAYDPAGPEPSQRNVARRIRDLPARGTSALRGLMAPLGLHPRDQLRALVCEGPDLLAWVGAYRDRPFTVRERRALTELVPALRSRLLLERHIQAGMRARRALTVALEHVAAPAFLLSASGRVEERNSAGRVRMERDRAGTMELLRSAATCSSPAAARARLVGSLGAGEGRIVVLDVASPPPEMGARVRRLAGRAGLTTRQTRVVAALADGLSNRGIAASLGISPRTVESHLETIFDKLGVSSRAAVLAVLLELRG